MVTKTGSLMPSTFIPYCALGTNLEHLSMYVANMTFPACNMFQPTVFKRQLCYRLDISQLLLNKREVFQGKESGLMLVIDTNTERSINRANKIKLTRCDEFAIVMNLADLPMDQKSLARIHIGTLAPFTSAGPGDYNCLL